MPLVIKMLNAPDASENSAETKAKALEKPAKDWWSPEWSIVWATGVLAVIGAFQVIMFLVQLRLIRDGMNDAKTAAEAARDAANTGRFQAETASKALIATFRPKLFVRRMKLLSLEEGQPILIHYLLVNGGGTTATVVDHKTTICIAPSPATELSWDNSPISDHTVFPGGEAWVFVTIKIDETSYDPTWGIDEPAGWTIDDPNTWRRRFRGSVTYADDNGVRRTTGFNRVYDPHRKRLTPVGDPDYEYVD